MSIGSERYSTSDEQSPSSKNVIEECYKDGGGGDGCDDAVRDKGLDKVYKSNDKDQQLVTSRMMLRNPNNWTYLQAPQLQIRDICTTHA